MNQNPFSKLVLTVFLAISMFVTNGWAWNGRYGGEKVTTIRIGYYNPKDAKSGAIFGIEMSKSMDELVALGISADLFHRSYQKNTEINESISDGGLVEHRIQRELDFSTTAIPIMGTITIKLSSRMRFSYFLSGGVGYSLMWNKESNYVEDISENRFYHGFTYQVGGGGMFRLGSRTYLVGDLFYNNARLKRDKGETPNGLPVWSQVDLSGLGLRLGVRISGF